jgi:TetR/AcrR family transcriptional repressor of nem operon
MAGRSAGRDAGTASRILDVAEHLVQVRGFNGFSYADIAAELKITKAALHYHFPSKADLGEALITRYAARFARALDAVQAGTDTAAGKLDGYAALYLQVLRDERMCLCGMLAAEYQTLPQPMRDAVLGFFDRNERWLEQVLAEGRAEHSLRFTGSARDTARMIISGLEGAMLVARPYGDVARFQAAAESLLAGVSAADGPAGITVSGSAATVASGPGEAAAGGPGGTAAGGPGGTAAGGPGKAAAGAPAEMAAGDGQLGRDTPAEVPAQQP